MDPMNYDPKRFRIESHGDSQEKGSAEFLRSKVQSYEVFWSNHVVPLTCRIFDENLRYVRPFLQPRLRSLVNASYATMYHLTWSERYRARIAASAPEERAAQAEGLYCFLCHSSSFVEALGALAHAVDQLTKLATFREAVKPPFGANKRAGCFHWEFEPADATARRLRARRASFRKRISDMRNTVVHDCPIYIVKGRIPPADRLQDYLGLAALAQVVVGEGETLGEWRSLVAEVAAIGEDQAALANGWYGASHSALSKLPAAKYRGLQWQDAHRASGLTQRDFDRFLGR